jgi:hemerythrin
MAYEWTPDLSVGIPEIDAQHGELLGRISELHRCMNAGETSSVPAVLAGLRGYVKEHFDSEERHMREIAYPGIERHLAQHARFAAELEIFEQDWGRRGTTPSLTVDLAGWLSDWFREHIRGYDREVVAFLRASKGPGW